MHWYFWLVTWICSQTSSQFIKNSTLSAIIFLLGRALLWHLCCMRSSHSKSDSLQASLKSLEAASGSLMGMSGHGQPRTSTHGQAERTDDFDCTVCLKLLYEPVTTPCGHSFCHSCLFQSMDHGNRCPLCRTVLFISPRTCSISVTLKSIIQKNFPEEYARRKQEHDSLTNFGVDLLPLFVMDVVMPYQKLPLNIFEP